MSSVTETPMPPQQEPDDVRLGMALGNALIHATSTRSTEYANQTVGDFFRALWRLGVSVDDRLASIEFGVSQFGSGHIRADRNEQGAIEVREVSR